GNFALFVRPDHENPHRSSVFLYFGDTPQSCLVLRSIDGDSQVFQTLARALPDHGCVLTYTASEHNGVYAAEHSDIRADIFFDAVAGHLDRQLCTIISPPCLIDNFPHVVQPANTLEAALRIERFFELIRRHPRLSHDEKVERRIDVSRPRAHDQAFEWGQAHGSVY